MRKLSAIAPLAVLFAVLPFASFAQERDSWEVQSLNQVIPGTPEGGVTMTSTTATGTNGVFVRYGDTVLMADNATVNFQTGAAAADGHVRIEMGGQIWLGEHINYNFKTHQMHSEQFRTGKPPVFAAGENLQGDISNKVYTAQHITVTTDDVSDPAIYIRARRVRMVPGKSIEAWNAVVFADGVPAFYYPYYKRNLARTRTTWIFCPATAAPTGRI
jgi:lipopolysaccharide assembly outer membrane protein LptD (OstA)